jgi:hypothetical protein
VIVAVTEQCIGPPFDFVRYRPLSGDNHHQTQGWNANLKLP